MSTSTTTPLSPSALQTGFEHSIWYLLSLWPALHVACSSNWGGPDSSDKKDWFAGAVSDLFLTNPDTDQEDLECFLLQIMQDEFDCNVEDETEVGVARDIMSVKTRLMEEGTLRVCEEVEMRWKNRGQMKEGLGGMKVEVKVVNQDVEDGEEGYDGIEEEEEDEEMEEAPRLVQTQQREKLEPEVDEDGFTKVVGKKRR